MKPERIVLVVLCLFAVSGSSPASAGGEPAGDASAAATARAEEWSTRLIYQKAMIDEWRKRLDRATAAYARAVAEGAGATRIDTLAGEKEAAASELRAAEDALPRMLEDARKDGVGEDVLGPYRFVGAPARGS